MQDPIQQHFQEPDRQPEEEVESGDGVDVGDIGSDPEITMPEDAVVETQDEDFKDGDKMEGVEPQPELEPSPPPLPAPESPVPPTQPSQEEEKGIDDSPETKCVVIEDSPVPFKKGLTDEEIHASIRDMEKKLAGLKRVRIAQLLSYFCFPTQVFNLFRAFLFNWVFTCFFSVAFLFCYLY